MCLAQGGGQGTGYGGGSVRVMKTLLTMAYLILQSAWVAPLWAGEPPAGVLRAGTLANPKLVHDAMAGVVGQVSLLGCDKTSPLRFVPMW